MTHLDMSVVIGFRDWGASRLNLAVKSIQNSFGKLAGEVILVDYGSSDPTIAIEIAERFQLKLAQVTDAPVWSRSRALNAGFALAAGDLYVSTDADMLFAPKTLEMVYQWWRSSGDSAMFLQCRDLPENVTIDDLSGQQIDWQYLESVSALRPRWGVGGMMAISQTAFRQMRGLDERMTTYGREDMDFALRARRMGLRMVWVEEKSARIYHMWHPPTSVGLKNDINATRSVNINRKIYSEDATVSRNRTHWLHSEEAPLPIVSIVFTDGLKANQDLIQMLRLQTVSSFEIIVPEHCASDFVSLPDSRIRLCPASDGSLASLIDSCRGRYVLPLSGVKVIARNYLEKMLDQMGGMTRLVIAGGLHGESEESDTLLSDASRKLRGCMFEGTMLAAVVKRFEQERTLTRDSFIAIAEKNCLEYTIANGAYFLEDDISAVANDDEISMGSVIDSDLFWPFLVARDSEISVQVAGENIALLDGVPLKGDLTISTVSIDGKYIYSDSLLRNATVEDLLTLFSHGCKFTRVDMRNNVEVTPVLGQGWAIDALKRIVDRIQWTPYSAIFVDRRIDDPDPDTLDTVCYSSVIQRKHNESHEDLKIFLTRDKQESDLVFNSLQSSVKFVLLGITQGVTS
ncbi:glycosyltransferase family 2 protein [Glutamicibacter ardleyensis]|uniref:glycosyltransferase family 2 protein n=1 Tax=Glutamicibacter ardleyensis TaxID=225894 RepID=UPI003FD2FAAC